MVVGAPAVNIGALPRVVDDGDVPRVEVLEAGIGMADEVDEEYTI